MQTENFSYEQITILTGHRQADIVLSQAMANLLIGAGFKRSFEAMETLRATNVENCAKALREAGVTEEHLEQSVAQNFAERFAHYWPELDVKLGHHFAYMQYCRKSA